MLISCRIKLFVNCFSFSFVQDSGHSYFVFGVSLENIELIWILKSLFSFKLAMIL